MTLLTAEPILNRDTPSGSIEPSATLAIVLVGNDSSSELYVALKQKRAKDYGVNVELKRLSTQATNKEVVQVIESLNTDQDVNGIIVQLPLPSHLDTDLILSQIEPSKDVDALTSASWFTSPMVQAVWALVQEYKLDLKSKKLCIVGYGRLVGQPLAQWLLEQGYNPAIVDETTSEAVLAAR